MQRESTLRDEAIYALRQGLDLIERIGDDLYCSPLPPFYHFGVGSHFRHVLDFYNCFLTGFGSGKIDYDSRERDERIEKDRLAAMARIGATIGFLQRLSPFDHHEPVLVRAEDADEGLDPTRWGRSSIRREIQFLLSHTVHHYALIALMLRLRGFEPGEEFGVAPSTLARWRAEPQCAK